MMVTLGTAVGVLAGLALAVGILWLVERRRLRKISQAAWARLGRPWEFIPNCRQCACGEADYGLMNIATKPPWGTTWSYEGCSKCRGAKK